MPRVLSADRGTSDCSRMAQAGSVKGRGPLECRAAEPPGLVTTHSLHGELKVKLKSKLHCTRVSRLLHLAERGVAEVSVRVHELSLVKKIENIGTKLEVPCLRKSNSLGESNVPLVLSRTTTDRTRRGRKSAGRGIRELSGIEIEVPVLFGVKD